MTYLEKPIPKRRASIASCVAQCVRCRDDIQPEVQRNESASIIIRVHVQGFGRPREHVFGATVRQLTTVG